MGKSTNLPMVYWTTASGPPIALHWRRTPTTVWACLSRYSTKVSSLCGFHINAYMVWSSIVVLIYTVTVSSESRQRHSWTTAPLQIATVHVLVPKNSERCKDEDEECKWDVYVHNVDSDEIWFITGNCVTDTMPSVVRRNWHGEFMVRESCKWRCSLNTKLTFFFTSFFFFFFFFVVFFFFTGSQSCWRPVVFF